MFKNVRLAILFDMLPNPSFKMTTSFADIARTTASTSKYIYYNHLHNILRLFNVLPNFPLTTGETMRDYDL